MLKLKTLGCRPTFGEVLEYYTCSDFLEFLLATCLTRRVVMIIPTQLHWEPDWSVDLLRPQSRDHLWDIIQTAISERFPEADPGEKLDYYPSFHQSLSRWHRGAVGVSDPVGQDFAMEADLAGWRASFDDLRKARNLLDSYEVFYRTKFSGHRSLHLIIPMAGPHGARLFACLQRMGNTSAHRLPDIMRVPYSLNEDTGLVSLPIPLAELEGFRPWQASPNWVEIDGGWHDPEPDVSGGIADLLASAAMEHDEGGLPNSEGHREEEDHLPRLSSRLSRYVESLKPLLHEVWLERLSDPDPEVRRIAAWYAMVRQLYIPEDLIRKIALLDADPEVRWFIIENCVARGVRMKRDLLSLLLKEQDEYAGAATVDLLKWPDGSSLPLLFDMLMEESAPPSVRERARAAFKSFDTPGTLLNSFKEDARYSEWHYALKAIGVAAFVLERWDVADELFSIFSSSQEPSETDVRRRSELLGYLRVLGEGFRHPTELIEIGSEAVDALAVAVGSHRVGVGREAVFALAEIGNPRGAPALVDALGKNIGSISGPMVRKAKKGLRAMSDGAVDALMAGSEDGNPLIRKRSIALLGEINAERASEAIAKALNDEEPQVRRAAAAALSRLGAEGERALLAGLDADRRRAQVSAAYGLGLMGHRRGFEVLVDRLDDPSTEASDEARLFTANLPSRKVVLPLIERLDSEDLEVVIGAIHTLGKVGGAKAVWNLSGKLKDARDEIRQAALGALRAIGTPKALAALQKGDR